MGRSEETPSSSWFLNLGRAEQMIFCQGLFVGMILGMNVQPVVTHLPKKTPMIDDVPNAIFIHYPDELTSPKSSHWRLFCDLSLGSISELNAPCRTAGGTGTDKKRAWVQK